MTNQSTTTKEAPSSRPVVCSACGQQMYYEGDARHEPEIVVTVRFRNGDYSHRNDGGDTLYVHERCFEGFQIGFSNSCVSAPIVAPVAINTGLHCNGCGLLIEGWPNVYRCVTRGCGRIYHYQCLLDHCASDHLCQNCKQSYKPYVLRCDKCGAEAFDCCLSEPCKQCGESFTAPASTVAPQQSVAARCPDCGARLTSNFDEDVGMWEECTECEYRNALSSQPAPAPAALRDEADLGNLYGVGGEVYTFIHQMRTELSRDPNRPAMTRRARELLDAIAAHDAEVNRIACEVTAECKAELAATTPPSTLAKAAAEEIEPYLIDLKAVDQVAAIIERCLAGGE